MTDTSPGSDQPSTVPDDFVRAPNISADPELYERENEAIARDGRLDAALREAADWRGRDLLDVGCGTGFWLPLYARDAGSVVGVEPDPDLVVRAAARAEDVAGARAMAGSAEHLPLEDASVDVAHARFAYFFGEGADAGLAEVRRVLRPGSTFVAVDNDWGWGEFAELLRLGTTANAGVDPGAVDQWWRDRGADRVDVHAGWQATSPAELEALLRLEFPDEVVDEFLLDREPTPSISYGVALFLVRT